MMNEHASLAIFVILYFGLALAFAVYVCMRQGFSRSLGWFYLLSLPIVRIAGAACTIAAWQHGQRKGLIVGSGILNGLGLVALLLTLLGIVDRCNASMYNRFRYAIRGLPIAHILAMISIGLAISGGINSASSNPDSVSVGHGLRQAAAILLLVVYLVCVAVTVGIVSRIGQAWAGDRFILWAAVASFPFLLVRVVYTIIVAFTTGGGAFGFFDPNVYVQAFMQIMMECIVVALYLVAGMKVPPVKAAPGQSAEAKVGERSTSFESTPKNLPGQDVELGTLPSRT